MSAVRAAAGGELETKRIRFYTLPPRGVEWPYLLVNCRNYRELFKRRFEHAILDTGVELFFDKLRLRGYPKWFLTMWRDLAKRLSKLFEGKLWVVIPDVPSDYHPSDWSNGLNVELTLKNVEDFASIDGVDWVVVVQSRFDDLLSYYSSLKRTKEIVGDYPRIAIGTVCKTRNLRFIIEVCKATRTWFPKSHVHAFGLTLTALPMVAKYIDSWDSLAYTFPRERGGRSCKTQAERAEYFEKYLERVEQCLRLVQST